MILRIALAGIVIAFLAAEVLHPTTLHSKKIATRALLTASQDAPKPRIATLDPELLDDLPRIRPDAPATITRDAGGTIAGIITDPYTHRPGLAVFPIIDDARVTDFAASYRQGRYAIMLSTGSPTYRYHAAIGLIAADQRGYFRSERTLILTTP